MTALHSPTGAQRAAVLVVALGIEAASMFLPSLSDAEVEAVSVEVARLDAVPAEAVAAVLAAYREAMQRPTPTGASGGLGAARDLVGSLGEARANAIRPRVEAATEGTGFDLVAAAPAADVAAFLAEEHPQAAAVVLSRLGARPAADVLAHLPSALRSDVIRRLASLTPPAAPALRELDAALRARFGAAAAAGPDGARQAADILTQAGTAAGREVLADLSLHTPDLASRIEDMLFVFEDLGAIDGRALGPIIAATDTGTLALALHGCDPELESRVFGCISERVGAALREEMEMVPSPNPADVAEARLTVIGVALGLADSGAVSLQKVAMLTPA